MITISKLKETTKTELLNLKPQDADTTRDMILCIENEYSFYQNLKLLEQNYNRKIKAGIFEYGPAVKGMLNLVDMVIKEQIRKFNPGHTLKSFISVNDRIYISVYMLEKMLEGDE